MGFIWIRNGLEMGLNRVPLVQIRFVPSLSYNRLTISNGFVSTFLWGTLRRSLVSSRLSLFSLRTAAKQVHESQQTTYFVFVRYPTCHSRLQRHFSPPMLFQPPNVIPAYAGIQTTLARQNHHFMY